MQKTKEECYQKILERKWAKSQHFQHEKNGGAECKSDILGTAASSGGRFEAEVKTMVQFISTYLKVNSWKVWTRLSQLLRNYGP